MGCLTMYLTGCLTMYLTGCLLIVTGIFYMLKTFKTRRDQENASILVNSPYDRYICIVCAVKKYLEVIACFRGKKMF